MTKLEQAARQALEALTELVERFDYEQFTSVCELDPAKDAITALREALAERHKESCACEVCRGCDNADIKAEQAEQRSDSERMEPVEWNNTVDEVRFKEPVIQEPVAWLWVNEHGSKRLEWEPVEDTSKWKSTPLYAAPVSIVKQSETDSSSSSMRTTVRTKDLTDDEIQAAIPWVFANEHEIRLARAVIAADREKNK